MTDRKILVFDMDGTIADFYGVNDWLKDLENGNTRPYEEALPLYNMETLTKILKALKVFGWEVVITSWVADKASKEYAKAIRKAKINWLAQYRFPCDTVHIVKYGTTKANCTRKMGGYQILIDDNEKVRNGWKLGDTINANENILEHLFTLLENERKYL